MLLRLVTRLTNRVIDLVLLTQYFIQSNWKALLTSLIGLIIALSVISESTLLLNSYRGEILQEMGAFGERRDLIGDIHYVITKDQQTTQVSKWVNLQQFHGFVSQSLEQTNYQNYMRFQCWHSEFGTFSLSYDNTTGGMPTENTTEEATGYISLRVPDNNFFTQAVGLIEGRFPENFTEVIMAKFNGEVDDWWGPSWQKTFPSGIRIGEQMKVSLSSEEDELKSNNITLTIVGIIEYNYISRDSQNPDLQSQLIYNHFGSWESHLFVTSPSLFKDFYHAICSGINTIGLYPHIHGRIFLDYSQFDGFNINHEIRQFDQFQDALATNFYRAGFALRSEDYSFKHALEGFKSYTMMLGAMFFVFSVPVIGIALYLVVYSTGIVKRQKREKIGILKTRGSSSCHIFIFLLGELALGIFLAIMGGIILGYLLTGIVVQSVDLLDFSGKAKTVIFSERTIHDLIVWGIGFAIGVQSLTIIRTSRTTIIASVEPVDKRPPIWNRYYLDIWATGLGFSGLYLILLFFSFGPEQMPDILYELAPILLIPAPFLMFIGVIFLLSRLFPLFSRYLATFFWKVSGGVTAFALKSVVRHKYSANRAVIMITLALTYSVFSGSFIHFFDINSKHSLYFDTGADILASTPLNNTIKDLIQDLDGVQTVSGGVSGFINSTIPMLAFKFVDPKTFPMAVYFKESLYGISSPLPDLMNTITDNQSVILYEGNLQSDQNLDIGKFLQVKNSSNSAQEIISLKIVGTFSYWPGFSIHPRELLPYHRNNEPTYYKVIGSLGLFEFLKNQTQIEYISSGYYISLESDVAPEPIVSQIYSITNVHPYSAKLAYQNYLNSFAHKFIVSILNSDLLICITITVVSITMFAFFTYIDRGKEIGVERALGMTRTQLGATFIIEGGIIMLFGTIIGVTIGLFYSTIVMRIFATSANCIIIDYPIEFLFKLICGLFLAATIGLLLPACLASKKDISNILKTE